MKHTVLSVALLVISGVAFSQQASLKQSGENAVDRRSVLKTTLAFSGTVEETLFWPLYELYEQRMPEMSGCTLVGDRIDGQPPRQTVEAILRCQADEIAVKNEFFRKIDSAINGTIALRFIQSETLTDLILKSRFFETTNLQKPVWNENMIEDEKAKLDLFAALLRMSPDETVKLQPLLSDYEFEYSRVVGHAFVWFEQYIEDLSDLTPAQSSTMGMEFLEMQEKEIKLKQRFFNKVADVLGEDLAARFLPFRIICSRWVS